MCTYIGGGKRNRKKLYEGKAKILYEGATPDTAVQYFKDDATAFNRAKHAVFPGKGILNNRISERVMQYLAAAGIETHFIKALNMREQLIRRLEIIPVEVIVRNYAAGSLCKRLGVQKGVRLPFPLIEFCYKNDELNDPLINEEHILALDIADLQEIDIMRQNALRINDFLTGMFAGVRIRLVDFKMEFGRPLQPNSDEPEIILADEISPDSCRLWDMDDNSNFDKDRFRENTGGLTEAYATVASRLGLNIDIKSVHGDNENDVIADDDGTPPVLM